MTTKEISQGQVLFESGQKLDALYLIVKGSVSVFHAGGKHMLRSGDVIGICELDCKEAYMEYRAEEKTTVIVYPFIKGTLAQLFEINSDTMRYFQSSAFRQLNAVMSRYKLLKAECVSLYEYVSGSYGNYVKLCEEYHVSPGQPSEYEEFGALLMEEDVPQWLGGYYSSLEQILAAGEIRKADSDFVCGLLERASRDIHDLVLLCSQMLEYKKDICKILMNGSGLDLLELMMALYARAAAKDGLDEGKVVSLQKNMKDILMRLKGQSREDDALYQSRKATVEKQFKEIEKRCTQAQSETEEQTDEFMSEELPDSLNKILSYAECGKELSDSFRRNIGKYRKIVNKNGTEDEIRTLRKDITSEFYQVYEAAFMRSLSDKQIPTVVKMFFNFGYVDEELAGMKNAVYLYRLTDQLPTSPKEGVYTFYEWLTAVYEGKKEPSRNEFDLDYTAYLHEEKRMGKISQEEESRLLHDSASKVRYELQNVFPLVNKMSFGRISTFCPVFSEHNVMKELKSMLVSKDRIFEIINQIRSRDYGAYYRETLFTKPEQGVNKEFINVEVLPDFILTPNVGTRGVMWQEIEGKRRTTPARMLGSIFQMEDLTQILTRLTGEFRWEMCKRIQGARWNDVSERSLTSEYFDYIQFYRKNQDLSSDAKDKIRTDMGRAKNSFKEMFIMDYIAWIQYESNGSPRLNKVARGILFTYCAFSTEIREKLKANPMYRELVERYDVHMGQKRHRMDNLCQKLNSMGKGIPEEIEREKEFLYM